jgi:aquaporin Z
MYMLFQVIGSLIGSAIIYLLVTTGGHNGPTATGANGWSGDVTMLEAFIAEAVFTFVFVLVVLGTTSNGAFSKFAGLAIGLTLILVHIVCIPITGTSVNPARSIAPAIFDGCVALKQLWLFIVAPFLGAAMSAVVWKIIDTDKA